MITLVAIPQFRDSIAPRFETAELFHVCAVKNGARDKSDLISCSGCEGFGRVRLLQDHDVNVLICNGIRNFYREMLKSLSIRVIDNVSLTIEKTVSEYIEGRFEKPGRCSVAEAEECIIPRADLICWAKELFESNGYEIKRPENADNFPVDLIGYIRCPRCGRKIKVAICCGAHIYRTDREIREFHHALTDEYQAAVYVRPGDKIIRERCRSYGIEFIDPGSSSTDVDDKTGYPVPLIGIPVIGHEAAYRKSKRD